MKPIMFYHESFEYQDEYDFDKLGETGILVPAKKIVCPTCNGNGSHFRTDLDENLLIDGMREDGDEEGIESYQGGAFDQVCTQCNGKNVVDDVWDNLPSWAKSCISEWEHSSRVYDAECSAERNYFGY